MNIVEFLKERKQVLKISAIALMGAATVYMMPAHMSSAMMNDGEPKSLQVIDFIGDNTVYINGGEQSLNFYENTDDGREICFRDQDFNLVQSCKFDVSESFDAKKILSEAADKLVELGDAFSLKDFVRSYANLSIKEISIRGKGRISLDKNAVGNWSLSLLNDDFMVRDFCEFDTSEEFDTTKFLSDAVDKLVELGDAFSLRGFVSSQPNLNLVQEKYPEMGVYCADEREQFDVSEQEIIGTKAKEIEIGLKLIESLPTDEEGLKDFLSLPIKEDIDRHKETYEKIKVEVDRIVRSADADKSDNPRQMKIANAIYCWVANNIKYIDIEEQNAFDVFENRCGICRGYSHLTNLMMRLAGVPSLHIGSLNKCDNIGHAFNAVYIDGVVPERTGWTLLDSTWAVPKVIQDGVYEQSLFKKKQTTSADGINNYFVDVINDANVDSVYSYAFDIKDALKDIITKYADISTCIDQINENISYCLCYINSKVEYKTINKFLEIKIELCSDDKMISEDISSRLKLVFRISKDAEKCIEDKNQKRFCRYFPAFYNRSVSFKEANRQILSMEDHSVECLSKEFGYGGIDTYPLGTETGLVYLLSGYENHAKILLLGDPNHKPLEKIEIPEEVLSYEVPIKIGAGIKSLSLQGKEEVDVSEATDLENIEMKSAEKYILEYGVLYRRNPDDTKGEMLGAFIQNLNGLKYKVHFSDDRKNIEYVEVYSDNYISEPVDLSDKLPIDLLKFKIKVGKDISALILNDEEVDISEAGDLETVNTDKSKKYICEQGALFERESRDKWQLLYGLMYEEVQKEDGSISLQIFGRSRAKIKIPSVLLTKYKDSVIQIYAGIETLILQGDEKIDIRIAWGLKNIDTTKSRRYIAEDGFLYERKDGKKGELVGIFDTHRQVGDIGYIICATADGKKVEKIIVDSKNGKILDLEALPSEITKFNVPIEIRSGIRSLKIRGDEVVELTCPAIEEVDASESNMYIVENGVLYEKDEFGKKGAQIVVFNKK